MLDNWDQIHHVLETQKALTNQDDCPMYLFCKNLCSAALSKSCQAGSTIGGRCPAGVRMQIRLLAALLERLETLQPLQVQDNRDKESESQSSAEAR
jgi:hypothetical protein